MRFSPGCGCCDCTGGTTKICGKVTLQCSYTGQAGTVVTATGPDTLSTTTDASGNYCFTITKKGTYAITAHGPCGTQTQTVAKPTCGTTTPNVNFTFAGHTLAVTYSIDCYEPDNGSRPYTSFYLAGNAPSFRPVSPTLDPTQTWCVQPGDYVFKVWDDDCFVGQEVPITVECSDQSVDVPIESKSYKILGHVPSCTTDGLDGVAVTISGDAGTGSTTTDANGDFEVPNLKQGCYYNVTLTKSKWKTVTYSGLYKYCWDGDALGSRQTFVMEPEDGFACFGLCCRYPAQLSIIDAQGTHPVTLANVGEPGGGGFTDCISVTRPAYPSAQDFGFFGILCKPDGAEAETEIVYRYRVVCQFADPGGQWSVQRFTPGCVVRGILGDPDTYHFAASYCDADGNPRASSGTTSYLSDGGTQPSPSSTCGPMTLSFADGLGLGPFQLVSL